jgi:cation transport regulator ChaC
MPQGKGSQTLFMNPLKERFRSVGILAYGSLLEEPGAEIAPLVLERISGVETPFQIEFFRSSPARGGAPTVVPVETGGARVRGTILVMDESVSLAQARDLLWRRETRNESTGQRYRRPADADPNRMLAEELPDFAGIGVVLYARFGPTLSNPTPEELAALAIKSAMGEAGSRGQDGISYLISLKRQGIVTPLMPAYEQAVLRSAGTTSLEDALAGIRWKTVV